MTLSNLTAYTNILENSAATPGLFDSRFLAADANIRAVDATISQVSTTLSIISGSGVSGLLNVQSTAFGALANGSSDDRAAFVSANSSALTQNLIYLPSGASRYRIASSFTVTGSLYPIPGAVIKMASGATLFVAGRIEAGGYQVFDPTGGPVRMARGGERTVYPEWFGAVADRQWANDCSITSGSTVLKAVTSHWTAGIVGKQIAVYGAGGILSTYTQPLTSTVASFISGTWIGLTNAARSSASTSERAVWGTDNTVAIQAAVDALSTIDGDQQNVGGEVVLNGFYLTRGVHLDYSRSTGTYGAYNGIRIRGTGPGSSGLENWDISANSTSRFTELILIGWNADAPMNDPNNDWVRDVTVENLELRQIENGTYACGALATFAAYNLTMHHVDFIGRSYEVMTWGGHSDRCHIHDCNIGPGGQGGPVQGTSVSGFNILGHDPIVERCSFRSCGQGMEVSSHRGLYQNNIINAESIPASISPQFGFNVGSASQGVWKNQFINNHIKGYGTAFSIGNTNGTMNRTDIIGGTIENGCIVGLSGQESNPVTGLDNETDTLIHDTSRVKGVSFSFTTKSPVNAPFIAGESGTTQNGLETWVVEDCTVTLPSQWCVGGSNDGGRAFSDADCPGGNAQALCAFTSLRGYGISTLWKPKTTYGFTNAILKNIDNNFWYSADSAGVSDNTEPTFPSKSGGTVLDGSVIWRCRGARPKILFRNNKLLGPAGAVDTGAIRLDSSSPTLRDCVEFDGHSQNFQWNIFCGGTGPGSRSFNEVVPANAPYSDRIRYLATFPTAGIYAKGTVIKRLSPTATNSEDVVTRTGWSAPVWAASSAQTYGYLALPTTDNGFAFMVVGGTGDLKSNSTEPTWNAVLTSITTDHNLVWSCVTSAVSYFTH